MILFERLKNRFFAWIRDFDMIQDWDKIIVWLSWWKDSFCMLDIFVQIQKYSKIKFELIWVYVEPIVDWIVLLWDKIKKVCDNYWIEFISQKMEFQKWSRLKEWIQNWNACQWCSYSRRISLMKLAESLKATKIAFWHNMDDIVQTFFMNINYWKKFSIMPIKNNMKKWDLAIIRPLVYVRNFETKLFCEKRNIQILDSKCPFWNVWSRFESNQILNILESKYPKFVEKFFFAYIEKFKDMLSM